MIYYTFLGINDFFLRCVRAGRCAARRKECEQAGGGWRPALERARIIISRGEALFNLALCTLRGHVPLSITRAGIIIYYCCFYVHIDVELFVKKVHMYGPLSFTKDRLIMPCHFGNHKWIAIIWILWQFIFCWHFWQIIVNTGFKKKQIIFYCFIGAACSFWFFNF